MGTRQTLPRRAREQARKQADARVRTGDLLLTMLGPQGRPISRWSAIFDSCADGSPPSSGGQKRTTWDKKCIELLVS